MKQAGAGPRAGRSRTAFVVGQLAMSTVLLVTAGLFVRSFEAVSRVPLGFDPDGVVVATLGLASHGYDEASGRLFYEQLVERLKAVPGVESVGLGSFVLLGGSNASHEGRADDGGEDAPRASVGYNVVDPGYFAVNRTELVGGRFLSDADRAGTPGVAVVNQALASRLWPGQPAVGRTYRSGGTDRTVVGVVRDGVYVFANEAPRAFAYYPFAQHYRSDMSVHVRASQGMGSLGGEVRSIVRALDPNVAVAGLRTMDDVLVVNRFGQGFIAALATLFAVVALVLGATGVYGVLAMRVAHGARELAVRMAVGAKARDVLLLVLRRGAALASAGCLIGLALALGAGRSLSSLLYRVSPFDVVTLLVVPAVLAVAAILASLVPARRATRVSPTVTLRGE